MTMIDPVRRFAVLWCQVGSGEMVNAQFSSVLEVGGWAVGQVGWFWLNSGNHVSVQQISGSGKKGALAMAGQGETVQWQ